MKIHACSFLLLLFSAQYIISITDHEWATLLVTHCSRESKNLIEINCPKCEKTLHSKYVNQPYELIRNLKNHWHNRCKQQQKQFDPSSKNDGYEDFFKLHNFGFDENNL